MQKSIELVPIVEPVKTNNITISWDYNDTNLVNALSNVQFIVLYSTDMTKWVSAGGTTNTTFQRQTTNIMEFYRVMTYNHVTHKLSQLSTL